MPLRIECEDIREEKRPELIPLKDVGDGVYQTSNSTTIVALGDAVLVVHSVGVIGIPSLYERGHYETTLVRPYNGSVTLTFSNGEES